MKKNQDLSVLQACCCWAVIPGVQAMRVRKIGVSARYYVGTGLAPPRVICARCCGDRRRYYYVFSPCSLWLNFRSALVYRRVRLVWTSTHSWKRTRQDGGQALCPSTTRRSNPPRLTTHRRLKPLRLNCANVRTIGPATVMSIRGKNLRLDDTVKLTFCDEVQQQLPLQCKGHRGIPRVIGIAHPSGERLISSCLAVALK
ncbi:hypothetical protein ANCCAN_20249, partial [Ancylostoma caninum]